MILVSSCSKKKKKKSAAYACKSILNVKILNSESQAPELCFGNMKDKTVIISVFSFLLFQVVWIIYVALLSMDKKVNLS